ncbi:unnamed protein product [Lepidochelys olivacea]
MHRVTTFGEGGCRGWWRGRQAAGGTGKEEGQAGSKSVCVCVCVSPPAPVSMALGGPWCDPRRGGGRLPAAAAGSGALSAPGTELSSLPGPGTTPPGRPSPTGPVLIAASPQPSHAGGGGRGGGVSHPPPGRGGCSPGPPPLAQGSPTPPRSPDCIFPLPHPRPRLRLPRAPVPPRPWSGACVGRGGGSPCAPPPSCSPAGGNQRAEFRVRQNKAPAFLAATALATWSVAETAGSRGQIYIPMQRRHKQGVGSVDQKAPQPSWEERKGGPVVSCSFWEKC